VQPHRISKSLSNENTFRDNLLTLEECEAAIAILSEELLLELRQKAPERKVRKAFVKVKFADFTRTTRECLCSDPTLFVYQTLLADAYRRKHLPIRLLGTGVRFEEGAEVLQPDLFEETE
jgi:DNA polymerase-4